MRTTKVGAFALLAIMGVAFGVMACTATLQATPTTTPAPLAQHAAQSQDAWQTYTSDDAAYTFEYPADAAIQTSEDASVRFKLVYVQFAVTQTNGYQGVAVMVIDNPSSQSVRSLVATRYGEAKRELPVSVQSAAGFNVNGREAIKLERDEVIGDFAKYTVLVAGDGVIYRINLFGGGVGGSVEPPPSVEAAFDRLVQSFGVLSVPLKPNPHPASPASGGGGVVEPPVATVFTYPLQSGNGVNYGVPTGIVVGGTRLEWLDYAIRNLDQWRTKCYGVDWARTIHTGEDWYRDDYLTTNTAGTSVYAVADGVVELHNPGISYPGNVVLLRHRLADGRNIYSMYGHVANVRVTQGQLVMRGQQIATVFSQGYTGRTPNRHPTWDSHLHFEMRWFRDGTNIYVPSTNAYGYNYPGCTYAYPGRGYTYIIHPDNYPYPGTGYVDGGDFIAARLDGQQPPTVCTPAQILQNGGFESGPPGTPWVATNSLNRVDPLIYKSRLRTGIWGGWLGNVVSYQDTLAQVIAVPANTQSATLTFWRYVQSVEPAGNSDDRMVVLLTAPDGQTIGTPFTLNTSALRNMWAKETVSFTLSGYVFPTATLALIGINDSDNKSSFFVDDVALVRQCPVVAEIAFTDVVATRDEASLQGATEDPTVTVPLTQSSFLPMVIYEPSPMEKDLVIEQAVCTNLVANGGFEDAASPVWTGAANTSGTIYNVLPNGANSGVADPLVYTTRPRTGVRSGRIGSTGVNGYWNELLQTVQLPPNVASLTLTYWRYFDSAEGTTSAVDIFKIGLETEKGIEIAKPQQIDNRSSGRRTWMQETLTVTNAFAYSNQKLWVTFKGQTNNATPSTLFVDDVQLSVCVGR